MIASKIYHPDFGYESTLRCTDESYAKFGLGKISSSTILSSMHSRYTTEYIDLYLIHSPLSGKQRRLETWRALIEQRNKGKLRSIGVSN